MMDREFAQRQQREKEDEGEADEPLTTADVAAAMEQRQGANPQMQGNPSSEQGEEPLFEQNELNDFRSRWSQVQTGFVDEPHRAVEQADELVAAVMKRLAEIFADERSRLEQEWSKGDNVSTEDLRVALRRYRSFFDRLLSV